LFIADGRAVSATDACARKMNCSVADLDLNYPYICFLLAEEIGIEGNYFGFSNHLPLKEVNIGFKVSPIQLALFTTHKKPPKLTSFLFRMLILK